MIQGLLLAFLGFGAPGAGPAAGPAQPVEAVVHAVIFYSPTCPHCHKVLTEDIPPLVARYGSRLVIAGVDVTTPQGQSLYQATVDYFSLGESRQGVPTLVVGSEVMVGAAEIPARFPGLIEKGLAAGGTDWPPVPAIRQALALQGVTGHAPSPSDSAGAPDTASAPDTAAATAAVEAPATTTAASAAGAPPSRPASRDTATAEEPVRADTDTVAAAGAPPPAATPPTARPTGIGVLSKDVTPPGMWARFGMDPVANTVAVLVFLGMLVAIASSLRSVATGVPPALTLPAWAMPVLAAVGMAVASYLAMVELTGSMAVCGPVGDCNTVQQSPYAVIFGVPVGVLGQGGYLAMFAAWGLGVLGPRRWRDSAWLALWAMALAGVAFSAYLTFLEPFVIGATCVWCLTSAVVMTLMLLGATTPVTAQRR